MSAASRKRSRFRTLAVVAVLFTIGGCQLPGPPTMEEKQRGLVWVFPGITGRSSVAHAVRGFRDAGVDQAIELHHWDKWYEAMANLTSYERNRRDAADVAGRIVAYADEHPTATIDLVGYSGGGGMAVFVAEALPKTVRVRRIILVQPAISPDYDLTAALEHVTDRLIHFHSAHDRFILGLGTLVFGTMDRKHVASAGRNGFRIEQAVPESRLRERFEQRAWSAEMMKAGHWGNHAGLTSYDWNRKYVAPLLRLHE